MKPYCLENSPPRKILYQTSLQYFSGSTSLPGQQPPIQQWKIIWSMPIPRKIQVFLGKACHEALAIKAALHYKIPRV